MNVFYKIHDLTTEQQKKITNKTHPTHEIQIKQTTSPNCDHHTPYCSHVYVCSHLHLRIYKPNQMTNYLPHFFFIFKSARVQWTNQLSNSVFFSVSHLIYFEWDAAAFFLTQPFKYFEHTTHFDRGSGALVSFYHGFWSKKKIFRWKMSWNE